MRMKSKDITIKNLNPIFTEPLKKFDDLHVKLMGNPAVVTSTDTGKHWGSIRKEDRPYGWQAMTEAQVKELSDSKHYTEPLCDALDFRRRNPDVDSDLNYYDDLTQSQQEYFRAEIYECFPDHIFDVVFSRLCIHVERDPNKPRKHTPKPRINKPEMVDEVDPIKLPKRDIDVSLVDQIDWKNMPKALMNGVFRYFTKFSLFSTANKPGLIAKLTEFLQTLINKLKGK